VILNRVKKLLAPHASTPETRRRMQNTRRRDTPAELALRRELHRRGLRYRVDFAPLPGVRRRADIVFPRARVAVFVDGCFWHSCPQHGTRPRENARWWTEKLEQNRMRDADTNRELDEAGWLVLRFWEHEDAVATAATVLEAVAARTST
jgi:DNA mismatch endonuclease (patch repair protein)